MNPDTLPSAGYPSRSNGRLGITDALWWAEDYDGAMHICQSQIGTVIADLQQTLRSILPRVYSVGNVGWDREQINVDSNFGPKTFAGLVRAMRDMDPPADLSAAVAADFTRLVEGPAAAAGATGQPIRWATLKAIIHVGEHRALPWSATQPPTDTVMPLFNMDSAAESARGVVHCDLRTDLDSADIVGNVGGSAVGEASSGGDNAALLVIVVAVLAAAASKSRRRR